MIPRQQPWRFSLADRWRVWFVWIACGSWGGLWHAVSVEAQGSAPRFVQEIPGGGVGLLIKCDVQRRFSDEYLSVAQFVAQAADSGCQAVFVAPPKPTSHTAALTQFLQEVETARQLFPKVMILPAYPWLIRAAGLTDQAMIILPPGDDFRARFLDLGERLSASTSNAPISETAGLVLHALCREDTPPSQWPAIIFNQRAEGTALHRWAVEQSPPDRLWSPGSGRTASQRVFGQIGLLDRWDQAEMFSGGDWDRLLADGWNAWAAAGGVDFELARTQRLKPGAFTETWLRVPELTPENVVEAVKHGAFFGVRGKAAREVELKLTVPGLARAAFPGETVDVPARNSGPFGIVVVRARSGLASNAPPSGWN